MLITTVGGVGAAEEIEVAVVVSVVSDDVIGVVLVVALLLSAVGHEVVLLSVVLPVAVVVDSASLVELAVVYGAVATYPPSTSVNSNAAVTG